MNLLNLNNKTILSRQKYLLIDKMHFKKKRNNHLEFKYISYICTRIREEKFELIATSLKKC